MIMKDRKTGNRLLFSNNLSDSPIFFLFFIYLDILGNFEAIMHSETVKKENVNETSHRATEQKELNMSRVVTDPRTQTSCLFLTKSLSVWLKTHQSLVKAPICPHHLWTCAFNHLWCKALTAECLKHHTMTQIRQKLSRLIYSVQL